MGIDYLDITLSKGQHWQNTGFADVEPFTKPTALAVPLGVDACHHPSVHRSWPQAEVHRLARRSVGWMQFHMSTTNFIAGLHRFWCWGCIAQHARTHEFVCFFAAHTVAHDQDNM